MTGSEHLRKCSSCELFTVCSGPYGTVVNQWPGSWIHVRTEGWSMWCNNTRCSTVEINGHNVLTIDTFKFSAWPLWSYSDASLKTADFDLWVTLIRDVGAHKKTHHMGYRNAPAGAFWNILHLNSCLVEATYYDCYKALKTNLIKMS